MRIETPTCTYRLQLRAEFGFEQVMKMVNYLAELGISHIYTSPFLQAAPGSTHGYDVVDPGQINAEIGNPQGHRLLCDKIKSLGLKWMVDVVPNHMAANQRHNLWWWDVLENGPSSLYAKYFDIDWQKTALGRPKKILLPVLGDHYGRVLENKDFKLSFQGASLYLFYFKQSFPIDPSTLRDFLICVATSMGSDKLAFLAENYGRLPRADLNADEEKGVRQRDKLVLDSLLMCLCQEQPHLLRAIEGHVDTINGDQSALHKLIDQQNYRLAFWRTASRELSYRRFFDITDLVGLKVEEMQVFKATHALIIKWFQEDLAQALRIDHPDGLYNPLEYFLRLKEIFPSTWIVAEKILQGNERLPKAWQISGTTGYDFLNLLNSLFVDKAGEDKLTQVYEELTEQRAAFTHLVYECKLLVLNHLFGTEVHRLTNLFVSICQKHLRYCDYTHFELREAICQVAACFPVYRSYVEAQEGRASREDEKTITQAIDLASQAMPDLDPRLFEFFKELLLLRIAGELEGELAMRFQQLTSAVMAKGYEDTALYRYHRLRSLNEVGGDPSCFGITLEHFHKESLAAQAEKPLSLLATTTHDTKHSEDFRARLNVLSEIPEHFEQAVKRWMAMNAHFCQGQFPDKNTQYLIYQTLIGAWPISEERLTAYLQKAMREAKVYTTWAVPNKTYEESVFNFAKALLNDETFKQDLQSFISPLIDYGRLNSLAQTLIKLTSPGVPDIYQGSEMWNLTLVDPDNRQLVDFEKLHRLLKEVKGLSLQELLKRMDEGLPKLWLIERTLNVRKNQPELFSVDNGYIPLYATGEKCDHVVAYMRGEAMIVLAQRFPSKLKGNWSDTTLQFPSGTWNNVLTQEKIEGEKAIALQGLLKLFPVALFVKETRCAKFPSENCTAR